MATRSVASWRLAHAQLCLHQRSRSQAEGSRRMGPWRSTRTEHLHLRGPNAAEGDGSCRQPNFGRMCAALQIQIIGAAGEGTRSTALVAPRRSARDNAAAPGVADTTRADTFW